MTAVGFIGLGRMGEPMARNLIAAGFKLRVFNRSLAKAEPLAGLGAVVCASAAEAAQTGGIVVTMLANDAALEDVTLGAGGILKTLGRDGVHLSMSTVSPETAHRLAEAHEKTGSRYVAAPVFGRPDAAAAKELNICLSGPAAAKARVKPLLEAMGRTVHDFGTGPGTANVVKLCGNFLILAAIESLAEALALAEKHGIDRAAVATFFSETRFNCPVYKGYGAILAARRYAPPGFALELGYKDSQLIQATAAKARVPMAVADLVDERLRASIAKGRQNLDWTAIELLVAEAAGLSAG